VGQQSLAWVKLCATANAELTTPPIIKMEALRTEIAIKRMALEYIVNK
jgi:hypothetical protein